MIRAGVRSFILLVMTLPCVTRGFEAAPEPPVESVGNSVLWYRQPGEKWLDGLPLGNGLMAAMVFGRVHQERIALNESSFWSGRPHDYDNPAANEYFPRIRDLVFAGNFQAAEEMANSHFCGIPAAQQAYQPLGDLLLDFEGDEPTTDYRRELDLETGIAKVTYRAEGALFSREVFVSYPDRVMVVRITCDKAGRISVKAKFTGPYLVAAKAKASELVADNCWTGPIPIANRTIAPVKGSGIRFQARLVARVEGGKLGADGGNADPTTDSLCIKNADAVTLVVNASTSHVNYRDIGGDPAARCEEILAATASKDFPTLRRRHEDDFRQLMARVRLKVGDSGKNAIPTDERLKAASAGAADSNLEALCFQFGRYLLVASSRAGGQPANLQGIWNESISPPWGSKYTININTQMNYWPAEVCNLSECHQPLFEMLKDVSITGGKTANIYYGCGGWVAHHNIDLWRGAAPVDDARWGLWPVGGAWLSLHLWEHYAYTGDREFLREYYPVLKGSAQFLLELLVEDPSQRWLVTPVSMSPEHGYLDGDGKEAFLSPGPTMDIAIIREIFPHCIEAGKILGVDEEFRGRLQAALERLPPYRVDRLGHLQEWIEDWNGGAHGHNTSPNFTMFPGSSIRVSDDAKLAAAIENWMEKRRPGASWPAAWETAVWARLQRPDRVGAWIQAFVAKSLANNLHNRYSNQTDANYGFTAAVAESLLQSHAGEIHLLPALPVAWVDGSITGLKARGGFEVDIAWKDGKLQSARIRSAGAAACRVRHGEKVVEFPLEAGQTIRIDGGLVVSGGA